MLRVGRRMGQRLGVKQYYEIHGCEDPTLLFTGRQKMMATLAMAQGCQSLQAVLVCQMAQVRASACYCVLVAQVSACYCVIVKQVGYCVMVAQVSLCVIVKRVSLCVIVKQVRASACYSV